ncbi:hydroxypyruvate isomerase family protein [Cognatishimia sp. WU-CL00825]|uniref:hydroxypyruvate isomerase family protein n=1 Tax=Cognatishimia sp. WU-CL00825 TaxID=3127658 RepID=UPI0031023F0A
MKFSANLGFLWNDMPLPNAIMAAKTAGFDAVECHWPYEHATADVQAALHATGLTMLGLNTARGDINKGEFGLSALPGRSKEARAAIDQAIAYATAIQAPNIHVMAGIATGDAAAQTFADNLGYACEKAADCGKTILIEPINSHDIPGYFLTTTDQALTFINALGAANLKLMFDCYHVQRMGGDVFQQLTDLQPWIGHIQIAAVPDRGAPDHGELDYNKVFSLLKTLGHSAAIGAEYKPQGDTEQSLGWLKAQKAHCG